MATHIGSRPPGNGAPDRVQFRSSIGAGYQTLIGGMDRMPYGSIRRIEATESISPRAMPMSCSSLCYLGRIRWLVTPDVCSLNDSHGSM